MKKGDTIKFRKVRWELVDVRLLGCARIRYGIYRVWRKYKPTGYHRASWFSNTTKTYEIPDWRWQFLSKKIKKNPSYHYNMSLWSNHDRL